VCLGCGQEWSGRDPIYTTASIPTPGFPTHTHRQFKETVSHKPVRELISWRLLYRLSSKTVLKFFKQSMGARNRVGIGLSYRPARLNGGIDSLESISGPPPPPDPLPAIHRKTEKERQLADGRGVGEKPSLRRREITPLYKIFDTLWFFLSWNKKEKSFYIMWNIYKQQKSGSFLQQVRQRMWRMHICTLTDAPNI
jgi:hypothetical protein